MVIDGVCSIHGKLDAKDIGKNNRCLICNRETNARFNEKKKKIIQELGEYRPTRKNRKLAPIATEKICKKHGLLSSVDLIYKESGHLRCKLCQHERSRDWEKRNPEKVKQYKRTTYLRHCERYAEESILRQRSITKEEYIGLIELQENKCAICFNEESVIMRKDKTISPLSIDHDHVTGKIRGLLCARCNRALGSFKDSEERLMNAIKYLRRNRDDCP